MFTSYKILTENEMSSSVRLVNILDAGNYGLIISTDRAGLRRFETNTGMVIQSETKTAPSTLRKVYEYELSTKKGDTVEISKLQQKE